MSFTILIQLFIALGIFNVWVIRFNKPTSFRGGDAQTMAEEFRVYGLSDEVRKLVGALKLGLAALLVVGIWVPAVAVLAASCMAFLMLVAVVMHVKVSDPIKKAVPAFCMMMLSLVVVLSR
ncbi:MAG: hypothetical protein RL326_378 [Pseudomonadota bacterium]|jgi:hypothetical protein